jgi:uncharacterized protein YecE (DUF72 family)
MARGVLSEGLKQADELSYATSKLTSIEINATTIACKARRASAFGGDRA